MAAKKQKGRPTKYRTEYDEQARKLCLLGYTEVELADFFSVSPDTITEWKRIYENFSLSLKKGRDQADSEVIDSLFQRAVGYSHPEDKIFCHEGRITIEETVKHYPPDAVAAIYWLNNRQRKRWRNYKASEDGEDKGSVEQLAAALLAAVSKAHDA